MSVYKLTNNSRVANNGLVILEVLSRKFNSSRYRELSLVVSPDFNKGVRISSLMTYYEASLLDIFFKTFLEQNFPTTSYFTACYLDLVKIFFL